MIDPRRMMFGGQQPLCVPSPGLHARLGVYACAEGVLNPIVRVDRQAEAKPGFDALIFHEALHAHEFHALTGILMLLFPVFGWLGWLWWRREQEVRADVFALYGAGHKEFLCFVRMHPHPTGRFWTWCYARDPEARVERALRRARRYRWDVR